MTITITAFDGGKIMPVFNNDGSVVNVELDYTISSFLSYPDQVFNMVQFRPASKITFRHDETGVYSELTTFELSKHVNSHVPVSDDVVIHPTTTEIMALANREEPLWSAENQSEDWIAEAVMAEFSGVLDIEKGNDDLYVGETDQSESVVEVVGVTHCDDLALIM